MKQYFLEKLPNKDSKKCANCLHFQLWGLSTGYCTEKDKNKNAHNYCLKGFKKRDYEIEDI